MNHRRALRALVLGGVLVAQAAGAAVLNLDAGFETPIGSDGQAADAAFFASNDWSLISSAGAPDPTLVRSAAVYRGAQALRFQADGSNGHTRSLRQDPTALLPSGDVLAAMRLRRTGPAPAGDIRLSVRTPSDVVVGELVVSFASLDTVWRDHVEFPIDASAHAGQALRLVVVATPMGTDPSFSIDLDQVRVETVEDEAAANLPNHSFEAFNGTGGIGDIAANVLTEWSLSSGSASNVRIRGDGGARGPVYVSAQGKTSGLLAYNAELENLPGSDLDESYRYEMSFDARYSGNAPSNDSHLWFQIYPATGPGGRGARFILPRGKIRYYKLTEEWQTFRLPNEHPRTQIPAGEGLPEWNIGDDYEVRVSPNFPDDPGSYVEIDNVRVDRMRPVEAVESDPTILVDTTRPVPNRWETDLVGSARASANSVYHFFLPAGVTILAAGNDPLVADPVIGRRAGNIADIYTIDPAHPEVVIEGERYARWTLSIDNAHPVGTRVGPIYFDSNLPAGTRTRVYYQTEWDAHTDPEDGDRAWAAGVSPLRFTELETRAFPVLRAPEHFPSSLAWIKTSEQVTWPGYLDNLASFGFNAIGGHVLFDGYDLQGQAVSPEVASFVSSAEAAGYDLFTNTSPWNGCTGTDCTIDAGTNLPVAGVVCPAYGLVDESAWGGSNASYTAERDELAAWLAAIEPEHIQLDSEAFDAGASLAKTGDCARCNAYHAAHPGLTIDEALVQMQIDRTLDLRAAATTAGASTLPDMGYYHTRAGFTYQQTLELEPMLAAGAVQTGIQPYYSSAKINGNNFRSHHGTAVATGAHAIAINEPARLHQGSFPRRTFDDTLEILGSGARGFIWWTHDFMVGADLYYFGRALESILPVESWLTTSAPVAGVSGVLVGPSALPASRYAVKATAAESGGHYFVLVSSYGLAATDDEDPLWVGDVDVTFPAPVTGRPLRISDGTPVGGAVSGATTVRLAFEPGAEGARTALFHFCDSAAAGVCDVDLDGLSDDDEVDLHGTGAFVADSDGDGLLDGAEVDTHGTDPLDPDSDGDGLDDGAEIADGADPNDANDPPPVPALPFGAALVGLGALGFAAKSRLQRAGRP